MEKPKSIQILTKTKIIFWMCVYLCTYCLLVTLTSLDGHHYVVLVASINGFLMFLCLAIILFMRANEL